ncbi:Crp/Fnr family transcriptional regulator [Alteromonas hispanica]|uniref:Helix-turn-helix domain-containing protein n=1 Tax=Alteromonas hispanica TaxID=315421 RepID=A0A6L9MUV9_9ALTE|nr:Crp/Fnr family transcriptional regulator [Alteromonas hispanica]NDW21735.1 helix-turn-helix domain-containing protein [Alteromonas hispanica]
MDRDNIVDVCKYCPFFKECHFNNGVLKLLKKRVLSLEKGDVLFDQDETYSGFYVLCSGSAKGLLSRQPRAGQIIEFYHPSDVIGLSGLSNTNYQESVKIMSYTKVLKIEREDFDKALLTSPALANQMLSLMSERIVKRQTHYSLLNTMEAEDRLIYFLREQYAGVDSSANAIELHMTRHDIANYLGIAVETLSRVMKRLNSKGIIEANHRTIAFNQPLAS